MPEEKETIAHLLNCKYRSTQGSYIIFHYGETTHMNIRLGDIKMERTPSLDQILGLIRAMDSA